MYSYRVVTPTPSPVDPLLLRKACSITDPSREALMLMRAEMATQYIEKMLGELLVEAPVQWVIARTPNENFSHYFKAILSPTMSIGGSGIMTGMWIELPGRATSIDSIVISRPGLEDVTLVENVDYFTDVKCNPAKFQLSYQQDIADAMSLFSSLTVNYTGGLAKTAAEVPMPIQMVIMEIVQNLTYSGGSATIDIDSPMIESVIRNYQAITFGRKW